MPKLPRTSKALIGLIKNNRPFQLSSQNPLSRSTTNPPITAIMRLPYAPSTPPTSSDPKITAETASIYERIAARRNPRPLIPLDLSLLHSPPVADGWNHLLGAIRTQTVLDQALLELSVCRVAVLNDAIYEWNAHAPLALKAGLSPEALRAAMDSPYGEVKVQGEKERVVLMYTDQMTRDIKVSEEVFEKLKGLLSEREIVELTACIASYNMVSRFLVALDVGENNAKSMKSVDDLVGGK
jgi:alkylhydroperoxidase family enzyme